jgi:hypothetical protein
MGFEPTPLQKRALQFVGIVQENLYTGGKRSPASANVNQFKKLVVSSIKNICLYF